MKAPNIAIALHGGAGTILQSALTPEIEAAYKEALKVALECGKEVLQAGGSAIEAVSASVKALEDAPFFNAGKGAVFNSEGKHEMDASIMCGKTLNSGAVAGVSGICNPVLAAKAVLEHSEHILMAGEGAEKFAKEHNIAFKDDAYFHTEFRYQQYLQAKSEGVTALDHNISLKDFIAEGNKFGTVGAVALDAQGNIAAATSTGGMTNKKYGRIGDSPIIGAGTYANNATCGVSCTGHGELFITHQAAFSVHSRMGLLGETLQQACNEVVMQTLANAEPESGGLVALDAKGNIAMVFNTEGMYRASYSSLNDEEIIAIYK